MYLHKHLYGVLQGGDWTSSPWKIFASFFHFIKILPNLNGPHHKLTFPSLTLIWICSRQFISYFWGLVSIIRMRGNHENYGFLVHYFNKYLPSANKNNIYCVSGKQKGTALIPQNLLFMVCIAISKSLVSKCKIIATIGSLKVCALQYKCKC